MKELFELIKRRDFRGLFIRPATNGILQFFRYLFVGGIATVADWFVLYVLTELGLHLMISVVCGFISGLTVNYILSKLLVFSGVQAKFGRAAEFLSYAIVGLVGLGLTMLIMWLMTDLLNLWYMLSKAVATIITLAWNYFGRKCLYASPGKRRAIPS